MEETCCPIFRSAREGLSTKYSKFQWSWRILSTYKMTRCQEKKSCMRIQIQHTVLNSVPTSQCVNFYDKTQIYFNFRDHSQRFNYFIQTCTQIFAKCMVIKQNKRNVNYKHIYFEYKRVNIHKKAFKIQSMHTDSIYVIYCNVL